MKKLNRFCAMSFASMVVVCAGFLHFTGVGAIAQPVELKELVVKPKTLEGGQPLEIIIRLEKKANATVKLNSNNKTIVPIQNNMPVHFNNVNSKSVIINTNPVQGIPAGGYTTVLISASFGSDTRNAHVTVKPPGSISGSLSSAYSIHKIKGPELWTLLKLAKSKGWTFTDPSAGPGSASTCNFDPDPQGIKLTAVVPGTCEFEFFAGSPRLQTGWTLHQLGWSFPPKKNQKLHYLESPKFKTDNLYFKVRFIPRPPGPVLFGGKDDEHLREIWLKGPHGAKWQDAF